MIFEKDLRELTDDELYKGINNLDPRYISLFSDELTRRSTDRWSRRMIELTILLFAIGFLQLIISIKSASNSWIEYIFGLGLILLAIVYVIRSLKKDRIKNK